MLKNSLKNPKSRPVDNKRPKSEKKSLSSKRQKSKEPLPKSSENTEIRVILSKKPPLCKKSSIDLKKPSVPKTPKNSKPKTFIQTLNPKDFNSDPEKSCKIFDKSRARSNLEHSLKTKLDLSEKILLAKNTSPTRVDQIIKFSLRKGKRDRILKEKEIKQKKLQEEIKKLESSHQNNLIRKINKQKSRVKKLSPDGSNSTGRVRQEKVFKLLSEKLKNSWRSSSTKRPRRELKENKNSLSVEGCDRYIQENDFIPKHPHEDSITELDLYKDDFKYPVRDSEIGIQPSKTEKIKVLRNISLIESEPDEANCPKTVENRELDMLDFIKFHALQNNSKPADKTLPVTKPLSPKLRPISHKTLKAAEDFRKNRAARVIQKAFIEFMEQKREKIKAAKKRDKFQELIQEQLGWREAQLVSLEYLKEKELEDLQSLIQIFGKNSQLEEILFATVHKRYEQFTKVFKENLEDTEQAIIQDLDTLEIVDFSNRIRDKKEVVSKIIENTNMNASLSKQDVEIILKETKDENTRPAVASTSCQTSVKNMKQKKPEIVTVENKKTHLVPNASPEQLGQRKPGPQILTEIQNLDLENVSISDILMLDPSGDEFQNRFMMNERYQGSTSPIPERPSAPLMFLDTDEGNVSLETLLNSKTPVNKKSPQGLPLLNLGNLSGLSVSVPITSDPRIETSPRFIVRFVSEIFSKLDKTLLHQELSKGITYDPLAELEKIHTADFGNFIERSETLCLLNVKQIAETLFDDTEEVLSTQRVINRADKIHKVMILAVADELLQKFRPYGLRGVPLIWSQKSRNLTQKEINVDRILKKTLIEVEEFCKFEIGKIPTDEMILTNGRIDEELLKEIREDALGYAIKWEIVENDWFWTDYEFEETQVKVDLADMILSLLAEEVVEIEE